MYSLENYYCFVLFASYLVIALNEGVRAFEYYHAIRH